MTPSTLWQTAIETGVETGQPPLFDLGLSPGVLPSLATTTALIHFAEERLDMTLPRGLIGGEGSAWVTALLAPSHSAPPVRAPALAITYSGADQATQIASLGISSNITAVPDQPRRELPLGFASWFAPTQQPGASSWAGWPFALLAEGNAAGPAETDRWLRWIGLVLAISLVVLTALL